MEDEKPVKEPQEIKMIATLQPNGGMKVDFPFLPNKMVTYGFLKLIEKTLDVHYSQPSKIVNPKNIMNFVRNIKH